ncbi:MULTISPECIES: hypothetical protein [unclassified Xanthobacter]|uniref:hypothetical protein n=1 Tax=unclassified Xanthobacter TaxID=2623496 RepID=UPI001F2219D1|nr:MULTISPECIES: hypothetical protein [unclassified Xanthobacter]
MAEFWHGITDQGMEALAELAAQPGWWQDVLRDPSLVIGVRNQYLNVYWNGQSIFKVKIGKNGRISVSTHPKYILNPDLKAQISLDGATGAFQFDPDVLLTRKYVPGVSLEKLKRAAKRYAGKEKQGVQQIAEANPNLIDVEIAFREKIDSSRVPRIDFATFEDGGSGIELAFWEAKRFGNSDLSDDESSGVIAQIRGYETFLNDQRGVVVKSYQVVANNLARISTMSGGTRRLSPLIQRVADGEALHLTRPVDVHLVVFGYTAKQKKEMLDPLLERIGRHLGSNRCLARGDAAGLQLKL